MDYSYLTDEMTPKERMLAFSKGEKMDRLPLVPDMGVTMAWYTGRTTYEYYTDAKVIAEVECALFERFHHDSVGVSTTLRGMAEAMGSIIHYPEDNITVLEKPLIASEDDLSKLKIINPYKDGKLPILLEALEIIRDRIGQTADIGASMTAPFSVAASVLGTERLLKWMVKKADVVHRVLKVITKCNEEYIKALAKIGFSTSFCDPVASTNLIKKSQFDTFAAPYLRENISHCHKYMNSRPTVHICGTSKKLWTDIVDMGIGNFSIDNIESLVEAKDIMGDRVTITGNVPPVDVMFLGSRKDVREAVRKCISEGYDSKCGYILSTGCQIPKNTPIENIDEFMAAGREFGRYPIDKEKLFLED